MSQPKPGDKGEKPEHQNEGTCGDEANHVELEDLHEKKMGEEEI